MFRYIASLFILLASATTSVAASNSVQLVMAEEPGCIWCARWNAEIGTIYDRTGEGEAAPLRRVDITDPKPDDITIARPVIYTPTFILLVDGTEVSRIEGYPGEDFFWGLLGMMLTDNDIAFTVKEEANHPSN